MRRNPIVVGFVLLTLLTSAVWADTLYLTNGSVLQGNFLRLDNGQIFFQLTGGGDRDRGRVLRFTLKEVLRIVTDRDPDGTLSRATPNNPNTKPNTPTYDTANVDVKLTNDWINSNVQVVQGQRIRVEATGTVTLDGRNDSSPSGIGRRDPNAPLPDENDGALVASIGNDLSSPILLIGRSKEWVADRNGTLYFTVNHWDTSNARGSYQVRVQTERTTGSPTRPPSTGSPFACAMPARFTETEGDYTATWTRRGNTNEYDAVWSRNGRRQVTAVVTITTQGNRISVLRGQGSDGVSCQYDGTVSADGATITGTATCGGTRFNFQARAECN